MQWTNHRQSVKGIGLRPLVQLLMWTSVAGEWTIRSETSQVDHDARDCGSDVSAGRPATGLLPVRSFSPAWPPTRTRSPRPPTVTGATRRPCPYNLTQRLRAPCRYTTTCCPTGTPVRLHYASWAWTSSRHISSLTRYYWHVAVCVWVFTLGICLQRS